MDFKLCATLLCSLGNNSSICSSLCEQICIENAEVKAAQTIRCWPSLFEGPSSFFIMHDPVRMCNVIIQREKKHQAVKLSFCWLQLRYDTKSCPPYVKIDKKAVCCLWCYQCGIRESCAFISGYIDNQLSGKKKTKQSKAKKQNGGLKG